MVVLDWLQTCEFVRANSEKFVLYCLCGCLAGIIVILLSIIIILFVNKYCDFDDDDDDELSPDLQDEYVQKLANLPVYRYNGRTHQELYDV
ncbi:unnamed protein product [Adineta ricciae]|uniref:Uncharacterized protein n=1 Tax=Adineta ricciae TaxID=249248 RepID=A0A814MFG0_ADIRI|nr:unnamed protein product [Adineta ricciae]CAF1081693.1 unnamed protein product [Adineta ricciae]